MQGGKGMYDVTYGMGIRRVLESEWDGKLHLSFYLRLLLQS